MIEAFTQDLRMSLLVLARILAMMEVAPLLSSSAIPRVARVGLALFLTAAVAPLLDREAYAAVPDDVLHFGLLLVGEVLLGILSGFLIQLVFSAFQVAGQFFALQMGFGAANVFDPLAQIEIPLLGQLFNLMAMLIFLTNDGFQQFLVVGVFRSIQNVTALDFVLGKDVLLTTFATGMTAMFETALTLSLPILGTLILVSVSLGLLAKAAPQMNLLILGFPVSIGVGFVIFVLTLPIILEAVAHIIDAGFEHLAAVLAALSESSP